jgi:uncharacterized protein
MSFAYNQKIAQELNLKESQVQATITLFKEGGTIPFIARYRKEATEGLTEVAIGDIQKRLETLIELDGRRAAILKSLEERNLLTDTLKSKLTEAPSVTVLEDLYQPFRPKRRTRAMIARERGLEPLATFIFENQNAAMGAQANAFINSEKEVATAEEALAGARDILAEQITDSIEARAAVRALYEKEATLSAEVIPGKETEGAKFKDYFNWKEPLAKIPSHRLLAVRRGEKEGILMMRITISEEAAIQALNALFLKGKGECAGQLSLAIQDGFKRLLNPSLETEARLFSKQAADQEAVRVFSDNLRQVLLEAPLGQKRCLGIDPGFRTGCKVVCLDAQGQLLNSDVIYIGQSAQAEQQAKLKLERLCKEFDIEAIAIGNGTASRETEGFVRKLELPSAIKIVMVNESGASIYSASEVAREEFPQQDITVRGAVSIGRRLMDPLAELVKIDPKSIGVGQYQHDVDQKLLNKHLEEVVVSCVNNVGVEVNTASKQLLSYVSGLNATIAQNIVDYRNQNGPFKSREALKAVPRLGPKAFEQAAGFLRIRSGLNPLDSSAVHPESYSIVEKMAADQKCTIEGLIKDTTVRQTIQLERYLTPTIGLPTLKDILAELAKPGRDPREQFEAFSFSEGVQKIEDLTPGMRLPGIITNVTAFGAFVDIGVHQDGLVHISHLSDTFVKNPTDILKVRDRVQVTVLEVDLARKRIALSLKKNVSATSDSNTSNVKQSTFSKPVQSKNIQTPPRTNSNNWNSDWFSRGLKK